MPSDEKHIPPASYDGGYRDGLYGYAPVYYHQHCPEYVRGYDDGRKRRKETGSALMPRPGPTLCGKPIIYEGGPAAQPPSSN